MRIAGTHEHRGIRHRWAGRPSFSSRVKQSCRLVNAWSFGLAQIQVGKQPPQGDAGRADPGLLDAAQPAHEPRRASRRGMRLVSRKLMSSCCSRPARSGTCAGSSHVIRLQYELRCPGCVEVLTIPILSALVARSRRGCCCCRKCSAAAAVARQAPLARRTCAHGARASRACVPFYEYGETQFFRVDGAPTRVAARAAPALSASPALFAERFARRLRR